MHYKMLARWTISDHTVLSRVVGRTIKVSRLAQPSHPLLGCTARRPNRIPDQAFLPFHLPAPASPSRHTPSTLNHREDHPMSACRRLVPNHRLTMRRARLERLHYLDAPRRYTTRPVRLSLLQQITPRHTAVGDREVDRRLIQSPKGPSCHMPRRLSIHGWVFQVEIGISMCNLSPEQSALKRRSDPEETLTRMIRDTRPKQRAGKRGCDK